MRELQEELGIKAPKIKDIATVKTFYFEQKSAWVLWAVYEVEVSSQEFVYGDGVTDARYVDISELKQSQDIFEKMVYSVCF